ncbi:hypothetical protein KUL10_04420 [Glaciecola sp. KUL10]|nr:hypothetical protein KUL10_04420 [Glaciecola sp. KUL10]
MGDFEEQIDNEAQMHELNNFPNTDYKITFCVRSPNFPIYKFPNESLSESNNKNNVDIVEDSPRYSANSERIYPDFLHVELSMIERFGGVTDTQYFTGAYYIKTEDEVVEVESEESGCRIRMFDKNKTSDTFNEYGQTLFAICDWNLYVGAEPIGNNNSTQVLSDNSKTKINVRLDEITNISDLRNTLGIYEEIPKSVRKKLEIYPDIRHGNFNLLEYLILMHKEYWTNYGFKDYLELRILDSYDIKADRFLKWDYKDVDKKIRRKIRHIDRNATTELLRLFINDALGSKEQLPKGVSRAHIMEVAQKKKIFEDGKTLGERCAKVAAKLIRPTFEERSDGHFKRSKHKFYPLKLWIVCNLAVFFWGKVDPDDHKSHPLNNHVKSLVLLINNIRPDQVLDNGTMLRFEAFLGVCPELKYFPNISFTEEEAKYVPTFIRPLWGYAKNR